jgi:hypothetical protein
MRNTFTTYLRHTRDRIIMVAAFVPIETPQQSPLFNNLSESTSLADFLNKLFLTSISIGAILAVIKIMWGGYTYMASNLWTSKNGAKTTIQNAVIGLLILLSVYLILYQINPCILNLDILQGGQPSSCQVQK